MDWTDPDRDRVLRLSLHRGRSLWVARALEHEVGLIREQIAEFDADEARRILEEARSRPR